MEEENLKENLKEMSEVFLSQHIWKERMELKEWEEKGSEEKWEPEREKSLKTSEGCIDREKIYINIKFLFY